MALELPLHRVQRWLHAIVAHPGTAQDALADPQVEQEVPRQRLGEVILPSATLSPAERLGIYHGMYLLRMHEALAADYPALQRFLGEPAFTELLRAYVREHPSRSYSLNPLGDRLPEFIAGATALPRRDFCHDLARLELAVSQVFDAPQTPPLHAERIAAVPAPDWERARLVPIEAFRMLDFRYNVNAYLQGVREERARLPRPRRRDSAVVIYRRDYRVYRLELTPPARELLSALCAGAPLGEAVLGACQRQERAPGPKQLYRWFRDWVAGGIFQSVGIDQGDSPRP